mgnify:CR=1 FL=1
MKKDNESKETAMLLVCIGYVGLIVTLVVLLITYN